MNEIYHTLYLQLKNQMFYWTVSIMAQPCHGITLTLNLEYG